MMDLHCEQIGRFFEVLVGNFFVQKYPKYLVLFGAFLKNINFLKKTVLATFEKKLATLCSLSRHTSCGLVVSMLAFHSNDPS